jgi:hypothetical protein
MRWLIVAPALAALAARLLTGPRPIDDAFITFRYARNLAEGLGLVYNPGEWVLGTTTPLWALLLALGYRLGLHDLPVLASSLSAICDATTAALLVLLAARLGWPIPSAVWFGLAWAINPVSIAFAMGGMETSLFVLVSLSALALAASGRLALAGLVAGISCLVRPEGILVGAVVLGWGWLERRRELPIALAGVVAPLATGAVGLWVAYGSPVPGSIAAKQIAYQTSGPADALLALVLHAGLPGWSTYLLGVLPAAGGLLLAVFGLVSLAVLARRGVGGGATAWQPFAAFGALLFLFYTVAGLRGVRLFPWYLVPLQPLYLLAVAAGLRSSGARASAWLPALLVLWQLPAIDWRQPLLPSGYTLERERVLLAVGRELADTLPATAVVAAPEIGALGYASNLRILDTVGLVSPVARAYYPLPKEQLVVDNAVPPRLIDDANPDAVVTFDAFAQRSLLGDPSFERDYRLERTIPVQVWQSSALLVFRRVDAAQAR